MSRIITPPNKFFTEISCLVINALDNDVDLLVLWLKTVPEKFDVHLWHLYMSDTDFWLLETIQRVKFVLVNQQFEENLSYQIRNQLERRDHIHYFGPNTENQDLVQFFIRNR